MKRKLLRFLMISWILIYLLIIIDPITVKANNNPAPTLSTDESNTITIMAVGDIMMHLPQIQSGKLENGYDFRPFFRYVKPIFDQADIVMANLETNLAGAKRGFSGYPAFNAPDELADALIDAGFNVLTTANNHSLDKGVSGLVATVDLLDARGITHTGTFRTPAEREKVCFVEVKGTKIAFLAYTYGSNVPRPVDQEYIINFIDLNQMKNDLERVKESGAEYIIVSLHFGQEYKREPDEGQIKLANFLFSNGVDLLIGHHPHVLHPYKKYEWTTEDGQLKQGVAVYSLGNFISNQKDYPRNFGGIFSVQIEKTPGGIELKKTEFIETYVHQYNYNGQRFYHVVPLQEFLEIGALWTQQGSDYQTLKRRFEEIHQHVSQLENPSISEEMPEPGRFALYIIQPGDTFYKLSMQFNTTVDELIKINPGIIPKELQVGQSIYVPEEKKEKDETVLKNIRED